VVSARHADGVERGKSAARKNGKGRLRKEQRGTGTTSDSGRSMPLTTSYALLPNLPPPEGLSTHIICSQTSNNAFAPVLVSFQRGKFWHSNTPLQVTSSRLQVFHPATFNVPAGTQPTAQFRIAFWTCSRFSAWVKIVPALASKVSSSISLPRYAGRQCITSASALASFTNFWLIW